MKFFASLGLLTLLTCLGDGTQIGKHSESGNPFNEHHRSDRLGVINGKKTSIKKFPFMVSILLDGDYHGTGVILNTRWILTTGFNIKWWSQDELSFRVGSSNSLKGGQTFKAETVVCHENYTGSWDYDVAVVKLDKAIKFGDKVKAIKLGTMDLKKGRKVTIAGWGPSEESGSPSPDLLEAKLTVFDWNKCEKLYPQDLTPRLMCTYDKNAGPCSSDCGDPLIVGKAVYGLYAGANNCLNEPALYTDVANLYKWIKAAIKQ